MTAICAHSILPPCTKCVVCAPLPPPGTESQHVDERGWARTHLVRQDAFLPRVILSAFSVGPATACLGTVALTGVILSAFSVGPATACLGTGPHMCCP